MLPCLLLFFHLNSDFFPLSTHQLVSQCLASIQSLPWMHCVVLFHVKLLLIKQEILTTQRHVNLWYHIFSCVIVKKALTHHVWWASSCDIVVLFVVVLVYDLAQAVFVNDGLARAKCADQVHFLAAVAGCSVGPVDTSTTA